MDFNFIPYKLNTDISYFKDNIQYISSDNGVDLYIERNMRNPSILGLRVTIINLYFLEGSLITVYIHLGENPENIEEVKEILETEIKTQGRAIKTNSVMVYGWTEQNEFLGLLKDTRGKKLYLYYTLKKYNVFESEFSSNP